jgi:hypothetical protein
MAGCVGDDCGVVLYYATHQDRDGLQRWRCARGTNKVECYHLPLRKLMMQYNMSPRVAHSVLLPFNYRRNLRMQVKHCGLPAEDADYYSQWMAEELQELTAGWWKEPLYQHWVPVSTYRDTGERTGLVASLDDESIAALASGQELEAANSASAMPFDRLAFAAADDGEGTDADCGGSTEAIDHENAAMADKLNCSLPATPAVKFYALMLGMAADRVLPYTRVTTSAEKAKFTRDCMRFLVIVVST